MSVALGLCLQPEKIPEVLSHIPNLLLQLVHQGYTCADSVCMSDTWTQAFFTWRLHACVHDHTVVQPYHLSRCFQSSKRGSIEPTCR